MSIKPENKPLIAATGGLLAIALLTAPLLGSMQQTPAPTKQVSVSVPSQKTGVDTVAHPAQGTKTGTGVALEEKGVSSRVDQVTRVAAKSVVEISRTAQEAAEQASKVRKGSTGLVQPERVSFEKVVEND